MAASGSARAAAAFRSIRCPTNAASRSSPAVPSIPSTSATVIRPGENAAVALTATGCRASSRSPGGPTFQCLRIGRHPFGGDDLLKPLADGTGQNAGKSNRWHRRDGDRDFRRLGGAEDELDVLGRLFEGFEQGVEGLGSEHVDFVDDVDLEAARLGRTPVFCRNSRMSSMPGLLAPSISRTSMSSPRAMLRQMSHWLQGTVRALFAVERLGQDAGGGGLADATGAGEQVGVADAVGGMAFQRAWATCSWPTSSSKVCGRYRRATTTYGGLAGFSRFGGWQLMMTARLTHAPRNRGGGEEGRLFPATRGRCANPTLRVITPSPLLLRPPMRGPPHLEVTAYGC